MSIIKYNSSFRKSAHYPLTLITLTTSTLLLGITPEINWQNQTITIETKAIAQNVSDEDLKKYAQAAMEIEGLRKTTIGEIQEVVGKSKPNQLNCHQEENFNQLPSNARNMALSYCEQSEVIVKKHGLTNTQFNQIYQQVRQNPALKQKLQDIIGQFKN